MIVIHIIPFCLPIVGDSRGVDDIVMLVCDNDEDDNDGNDDDNGDDDNGDDDMIGGDSPSILCCINW